MRAKPGRVPEPLSRLAYTSCSEDATLALAEALGGALHGGDAVGLAGDLGAGKTAFVRGLALGCGTDPGVPVCSPTFTLANIYPGRVTLYHLDLYRLSDPDELEAIGFRDYADGSGVVAVEWFDRFPEVLGPDALVLRLTLVDENRRTIVLEASGPRGRALLAAIAPQAATVPDLQAVDRART